MLCHIICAGCNSSLGEDTEVVVCNKCHLWIHRKCAEDVPELFYLEFYVATILGENPKPWTCHQCSQDNEKIREGQQPPIPASKSKPSHRTQSPLILPHQPALFFHSSHNSGYTSDSSDWDELELNVEVGRTGREGPASQNALKTSTTVDNMVMELSNKTDVIINSQPILSDTSKNPTNYTLYKCGVEKAVKDNLGNDFEPIEGNQDGVTLYQCTTGDCMFKVRVCETIQEFLCAGSLGSKRHNHTSTSQESEEVTSDESLSISEPSIFSDDNDEDNDENESYVFPEITPTPFNTPAHGKKNSSNTTDTEDLSPPPPSTTVQKSTPLNHTRSRLSFNASFSSGSDDNDDDYGISSICNHLDQILNSDGIPNDILPPSPASTTFSSAEERSGLHHVSRISLPFLALPTCQTDRPKLATSEHQFNSTKLSPLPLPKSTCLTNVPEIPTVIAFPELNRVASPDPNGMISEPATPVSNKATLSAPSRVTSPGSNRNTSPESVRVVSPDLSRSKSAQPTSPLNNRSTEPSDEQPQPCTQEQDCIFYEIESCLPRQKKPGSILVTSDGFILQTKDVHLRNNKTYWLCTENGSDGTKCEASIVFNDLHSFNSDSSSDPTWLIRRECGTYTLRHNHDPDFRAVTLAKIRMMIRRRIFHYSSLEETPSIILEKVFQGLDYMEQQYLDRNDNPVLTPTDKDYLPCCPVKIQVLKRFIKSQKAAYKQQQK